LIKKQLLKPFHDSFRRAGAKNLPLAVANDRKHKTHLLKPFHGSFRRAGAKNLPLAVANDRKHKTHLLKPFHANFCILHVSQSENILKK
jgi:hypothetical protein